MITSPPYPLKMPCKHKEVALYDPTLCTNAKLENNAQIKHKILSLALTLPMLQRYIQLPSVIFSYPEQRGSTSLWTIRTHLYYMLYRDREKKTGLQLNN